MKIVETLRVKTWPKNMSRRAFVKVLSSWAALLSLHHVVLPGSVVADKEPVPEEPENLDEPTPWKEGDPKPYETEVPATEPEQTSKEAPPSQPIDDQRPEKPSEKHVWVNGYWWWHNNAYVWVPGYWALPPEPDYVYIAGYWNYSGTQWVYVRGGWGVSTTSTVIVYAHPRPAATAFVITAPIRIHRRHHRWNHYHSRHYHHRSVTVHSSTRKSVNTSVSTPNSASATKSVTKSATKSVTKPAARPAARPGPRRP